MFQEMQKSQYTLCYCCLITRAVSPRVCAGALLGTGQSKISVAGCRFEGASAKFGSAAYVLGNSSLSLSDSAVLSNTAEKGAGVASLEHSSLNVSSSLFHGNNATDSYGGAIFAGEYCKVGLVPT
jgi:predicted outer membrane repeat protein